ncbi:MAG TPA: hypothetical protein VGB30_05745 [bacterium]|jgi:hypothetical protein
MIGNRNKRRRDGGRGYIRRVNVLSLAILLLVLSNPYNSDAIGADISVTIFSTPGIPRAVEAELKSLFEETLIEVLEDIGQSNVELDQNLPEIADAIKSGINLVIEPRGYSVYNLDLIVAPESLQADFYVHPYGWTETDPHAVSEIEINLSEEGLNQFWYEEYLVRLDNFRGDLESNLYDSLIGLPTFASLPDWSRDLTINSALHTAWEAEYFKQIFPCCDVSVDYIISRAATVTVTVIPRDEPVEIVRPRMYSHTLYNVILDRFRERIVAEADRIMIGMPKSEIDNASEEIESRLVEVIDNDALAKTLNAYSKVNINVLAEEPGVQVDAIIESGSYHMSLETFVDFGNETSDSSEVQARLGFLLSKWVEVLANLNFYTNDSELYSDVAIGVWPSSGTFLALGYDVRRDDAKYFIEHSISNEIKIRGEIFEEKEMSEYGLTYQFQQYLSGGVFTNGNSEFWVRAIFSL